jgi:penicillin amidase
MDYPRGHIDEAEFAYWVDDLTTAEKEDFKEMVRRGLIDTHKEYSERAKKESPEWQKLLTLTYRHPMGSFPILKSFLDRGPYTVQGGKDCIMINSFREDGRFAVDHLSTFRMIIDFSDFSNSLLVNSSGQSGHFLSPYYDDQIELYVNRKYRKMEDFPSKGKALLLLPKTEK